MSDVLGKRRYRNRQILLEKWTIY